MAKLNEQEFRKMLSSGSPDKLYLIYGEEKYLVKGYTNKLIEKVTGKKTSDLDYVRLNSDSTLEEIFSASEQLPVLFDKKCVVVSDYNIDALSDGDLKALLEYCSDSSPSTVLIFSMPTLSQEQKKGGKAAGKLQKFAEAVKKYGTVAEFPKRDSLALEKQLCTWAGKQGCELSALNASKIISMCGTDMTALKNEVDKLCAYTGEGKITEDTIDMLVAQNTEVRIFALSDKIAAGDYNSAYKQLYGLFGQNEKPEIILSVLSSVYLDMYRAKAAAESGISISQLATDFKYGKREFLLKNAGKRASRYSMQALRRILGVILDTDIKLKSTPADRQILLETLIARIIVETRNSA